MHGLERNTSFSIGSGLNFKLIFKFTDMPGPAEPIKPVRESSRRPAQHGLETNTSFLGFWNGLAAAQDSVRTVTQAQAEPETEPEPPQQPAARAGQ